MSKQLHEHEVPYIFRILHKAVLGLVNRQREDLSHLRLPQIDVWLKWDESFYTVLVDKQIDEVADMLLTGSDETYRTAYEEAFLRSRREPEYWLEERDIVQDIIKARRRGENSVP